MSHHQKPVRPRPPDNKIYVQTGQSTLNNLYDALKPLAGQPFLHQVIAHHMASKLQSHGLLQLAITIISQNDDFPSMPVELLALLDEMTFQHARLTLDALLTPNFMHEYVRQGKAFVLSFLHHLIFPRLPGRHHMPRLESGCHRLRWERFARFPIL